jgi:hypothetical protein
MPKPSDIFAALKSSYVEALFQQILDSDKASDA